MLLDYLSDLITRLGQQAYWVVFLAALLESAAMLGLLVPGEAIVLVAGFFAARQLFDLDALIAVVALGAALGDSIGYELGRRFGRPLLLTHGAKLGISGARIARVEGFFERRGAAAVFLGRFIGFARALVPFLAGASRMPYRQFLPYNIAGAVLWSAAFVTLGYFFGSRWHAVESWATRAGVVLAIIATLAWLLRRHLHWPSRIPVELMLIVLSAAAFAAVVEDVVTGDRLTLVDRELSAWFATHRSPPVTHALMVLSGLHNTLPVTVATAALALWLAERRDWRWLAALVAVVPVGMLLNVGLKHLFQRARPVLDEPLLTLATYSFPSGHVTGSTLFYGFLCALVFSHARSARTRWLVAVAALALVVAVGFSRIYLGAHFLSDVLAAFALGIAWLTLALFILRTQSANGAPSHDNDNHNSR